MCRQTTHLVTPSMIWPSSKQQKNAIIDTYKTKLSGIDCRYFDFGEGTCPFSTSCMYRHAYRNGQLAVRTALLALSDQCFACSVRCTQVQLFAISNDICTPNTAWMLSALEKYHLHVQYVARRPSNLRCALQDRSFRKRVNADGEVDGMHGSRLSDFVQVSLQSQQGLRRSLR